MNKQRHVPELRFPEFEGEWVKKKLGDVGDVKMCRRVFNEETSLQGEIPFFKIGSFGKKADSFITREFYLNYRSRFAFPKKGDILISAAGTIGRTVVYDGKDAYYQDSNIVWIDNDNTLISNEFLYFILQIVKYNTEGGTIQRLYNSILKSTKFSKPTLPEQSKIATFLTAVDEKLQALKKKKSLLEVYKKGVMQKLFSQELRFRSGDGKEFGDWEEKKGRDLFSAISNKNHKSDLPILAISQEFGAVPREMINYQISVTEKSVESYKIVEIGDFIISLRSFQGGIEYSNYKGICSPAYIILRNTKPINSIFFKYYFKTEYYIQRLCEKLEGIRDGKMISYQYFSEIELPYPSVQEQTRIANFISILDEKINHTQTEITKTEVWKKGLLQKMFV